MNLLRRNFFIWKTSVVEGLFKLILTRIVNYCIVSVFLSKWYTFIRNIKVLRTLLAIGIHPIRTSVFIEAGGLKTYKLLKLGQSNNKLQEVTVISALKRITLEQKDPLGRSIHHFIVPHGASF